MKATAKLLVAALAVGGGMLAAEAQAQDSPVARGARGANAMPRSSAAPSGNAAGVDHARHGDRGSHGTAGHPGWGHYGHRHHGHWGGYRHWSPRWSFYFGVPVLWGGGYWGGYWGAPYWYDGYSGSALVYREVERDPAFPEHRIGPATTEVPRGEGGPTQGPLYMNYCESAKAYYPKVTTCPEGWKLAKPTE
ncbi:MAG: hypothetical protein ABIQ84_02065 [Usitatibacter sp.]